jgi:hypothetical protein
MESVRGCRRRYPAGGLVANPNAGRPRIGAATRISNPASLPYCPLLESPDYAKRIRRRPHPSDLGLR